MSTATSSRTEAEASVVGESYQLPVEDVLSAHGTSASGLSSEVAGERLETVGRNELVDNGSTHPLRIVWDQISAVMVLILIGAAVLSLLLGKYLEAGAIGAIVVLFTMLGFFQEYRAEQAIAALRKMSVPVVKVRRDGRLVEVAAGELVPGDVVGLEAGTVVPADLRLIEVANLRIEEAALTGESEPVDKHTDAIDGANVALGDRRCMAFSGTQVAAGRGVGVVVATGMSTELGRIATLLQNVQVDDTPLQVRLDRVGKQLALVGVAVAALVVLMGAIGGESASDLVLTAISVAVAVIPEGLPAVVTFTLAIGSQRMLRRNALIRKLPAVETLGSVTVICSDKTGTLTENKMTVTAIHVAGERLDVVPHEAVDLSAWTTGQRLLAGAVVLCNDGVVQIGADGESSMIGDPTETALLQLVIDGGLDVDELRTAVPRLAENPFDSVRKRMSTIHGPITVSGPIGELFAAVEPDRRVAFAKGAIDGLIEVADSVHTGGGVVALDDEHRQMLLAANDEMAAGGLRVLGVGYRSFEPDRNDLAELAADAESSLTIIGLVGIIDPPRSEVRDAVSVCRAAGIRPVMITGDHPLTAKAIAHQLGIATDDRVLTGSDLDELSDSDFDTAAREVSVFARVSPEHKLRIVKSLQSQTQVVAMTGDGVNDAPALKQADIGVAMGITGTDVTKEASDMVLRDDNFATIVSAVEEGRVIYDNLRRFVSFAVAGQPRQDHRDARLADPLPARRRRPRRRRRPAPAAVAVAQPDDRRTARAVDGCRTRRTERDATRTAPTRCQPVGRRTRATDHRDRRIDRRRVARRRLRLPRDRPGRMADDDLHDPCVHAGLPSVRHPLTHRVDPHDRLEHQPADARNRRCRRGAATRCALHARSTDSSTSTRSARSTSPSASGSACSFSSSSKPPKHAHVAPHRRATATRHQNRPTELSGPTITVEHPQR